MVQVSEKAEAWPRQRIMKTKPTVLEGMKTSTSETNIKQDALKGDAQTTKLTMEYGEKRNHEKGGNKRNKGNERQYPLRIHV